jgi:endonuclease I
MKKVVGIVINILIYTQVFGQVSAYYQSAFNLSDGDLKQKLHQIINSHTVFSYTSSSTDVWDILKITDRDSINPDNVILIYSGRSVNAAQEYNSGSGWSREHVWAKSRGEFGTSAGAGTDVHHLRPCDVSVNSTRNNRNFDDCITCQDVVDNGFNTGSKKDANLWTFEPPNEVKGDVARMIFYMAIRYEGTGNEPDLELTNTLLSKNAKDPLQASLSTLLLWHQMDPVSDWERNRNEVIYTQFQNNRNPFIDYPELTEYLWGNKIGEIWNPTVTSMEDIFRNTLKIYPNPIQNKLIVEGYNIKGLKLYNDKGVLIPLEINIGYNDLTDLSNGIYSLRVTHFNGDINFRRVIKL